MRSTQFWWRLVGVVGEGIGEEWTGKGNERD
jgi:hypothetical protein